MTFRCKDLGLACEFEEKAVDKDELMKRIEGHVQTAHQMDPGLPEVQERLRKAMRGGGSGTPGWVHPHPRPR